VRFLQRRRAKTGPNGCSAELEVGHPDSACASVAPPGLNLDSLDTHGLRRGLHSYAAPRLTSAAEASMEYAAAVEVLTDCGWDPRLAAANCRLSGEPDHFAREPRPPTKNAPAQIAKRQEVAQNGRKLTIYLFRASDHSKAAPAAIPATARPVRFIDRWIASSCGRTHPSSG
jgi:hypothetical protein